MTCEPQAEISVNQPPTAESWVGLRAHVRNVCGTPSPSSFIPHPSSLSNEHAPAPAALLVSVSCAHAATPQ